MWALLDKISYKIIIPLAILMLLAPFRPRPHALEKMNMLLNGTLNKPVDIFDLFFHLLPTFVLLLKVIRSIRSNRVEKNEKYKYPLYCSSVL